MIPVGKERVSLRVPFVTRLLILANLAVFVYELTLGGGEVERFFATYAVTPAHFRPAAFTSRELFLSRILLPLYSSMFLHGGWLHVIGNMWSLWIFGEEIEDRLGHLRFLLFYLAAGILAGLVHVVLNLGSSIPTVGASGAIAGVMGAYFLICPFNRIRFLIPIGLIPLVIKLPAILYLLVWMGLQVAGGYRTLADGSVAAGGIAFWAHVGGFVAGMGLIRGLRVRKARKPTTK